MWCDNCLLIFPLRAGGLALLALVTLYQLAGGIFLFIYGQLFYFIKYEPQAYGAIAMLIAFTALIAAVGFSNKSYYIVRMAFFLFPVILILAAIRAGLMIFDLNAHTDRLQWECDNGGQQWNSTIANMTFTNETATGYRMPSKFCSTSIHQTYLIFTFALLVDFILLLYCYFLDWRMLARIRHSYELVTKGVAGPYGYA